MYLLFLFKYFTKKTHRSGVRDNILYTANLYKKYSFKI